MTKNDVGVTMLITATALLGSGCAGHRMAKSSQLDGALPSIAAKPAGASPAGVEADEPVVRDALMHPIAELKNVGFDYNSDYLGAEARDVLNSNAQWLKDHPTVRVQVTGNCDQRGTVAYNLALGQRRAKSVRDYYEMLGVAGYRVATISYGKERLLCHDQDETCWKRNRRAATLGEDEQMVGARQ